MNARLESVATPMNFYHPRDLERTPDMRSPEYVQMSTAAAITLGLVHGNMHRTACTHCLNLLVTYPEGCRANCSYCGLARHREEESAYADRNFIRVDWPTARYDEVIERVRNRGDQGAFERMCISMITHPDSGDDTVTLLDRWVAEVPDVPVSILSNPTTMRYAEIEDLRDRGADIFTVALDAVTPELFEQTRGKTVDSPHRWDRYWRALEWSAEIFGAGEIRGAPDLRDGRDRAGHDGGLRADPRHGRPQSHVRVLPGTGIADGGSSAGSARSLAPGTARSIPDRLCRRARRGHALRRRRADRRFRS